MKKYFRKISEIFSRKCVFEIARQTMDELLAELSSSSGEDDQRSDEYEVRNPFSRWVGSGLVFLTDVSLGCVFWLFRMRRVSLMMRKAASRRSGRREQPGRKLT